MNTPVILFTNKDVELPNKLINDLLDAFPECCQLTVANKLDFNREVLDFRYNPKVVSVFKKNADTSLFRIEQFNPSKGIPYIILDEESDAELLYWN